MNLSSPVHFTVGRRHSAVKGRATVLRLAAEGAAVGAADIDSEGTEPAEAALEGTEPAEAQWGRQYDFTFTGATRCIQASLPHLIESRGSVRPTMLPGSLASVSRWKAA